MQRVRDIAAFSLWVAAWSLVLAAAAWRTPSAGILVSRHYLVAIPVMSVILASRGAGWPRKLKYALAVFLCFAAFDAVFSALPFADYAARTLGPLAGPPALAAVYYAAAFAGPITALILFVRRDPSVLWDRDAKAR